MQGAADGAFSVRIPGVLEQGDHVCGICEDSDLDRRIWNAYARAHILDEDVQRDLGLVQEDGDFLRAATLADGDGRDRCQIALRRHPQHVLSRHRHVEREKPQRGRERDRRAVCLHQLGNTQGRRAGVGFGGDPVDHRADAVRQRRGWRRCCVSHRGDTHGRHVRSCDRRRWFRYFRAR